MRALTVRQPWCSAIVLAGKRAENRSRDPGVRRPSEWVALHAALTDHRDARVCYDLAPSLRRATPPRGAVVALIHLGPGRPPRLEDPWEVGPIVLPILRVVPLDTPRPCRGYLGLWCLPEALSEDFGDVLADYLCGRTI